MKIKKVYEKFNIPSNLAEYMLMVASGVMFIQKH